jgi:hypothetical protein
MNNPFHFLRQTVLATPRLTIDITKNVALVGFVLLDLFFLAYYASAFYPGYLTSDSLYMLSQGVGNQQLTNWHPPLITKIWGILHSLFQSAGGIWILQISLFILANHLFCATLTNKTVALACLFSILSWPPLFTNMAAVWKDNWAITFALFCASFAFRAIKFGSPLNAFISGLFSILASLTRIDYLVITLPMTFGAFIFSNNREKGENLHRPAGLKGFIVCLVIYVGCAIYVGSWVEKRLNPWVNIAVWDIAGVLKHSGSKDALPGYNCATSDPLVFGQSRLFTINLPQGAELNSRNEEAKMIRQAWLEAIVNHPIAYIYHRLCVAKVFLGFEEKLHYPYPAPFFYETPLTQHAERSNLNIDLYWFFDANADGMMFRYFWYLTLSVLIIGIACLARSLEPVQFLLFVSVFMSAMRFMILPAADFRYGLWIIVGSITLAAIFIDELVLKFCKCSASPETEHLPS